MDGGGRVAEPLAAGISGGAAPRPRRGEGGASSRLRLPFGASGLGLRRRSAVSVPLARRLPRLLGTCLALGFFAAVGGYGLVLNGQYDELRAQYGEPRDIAARLLGLGVEKITISGLSGLSEAQILGLSGISPKVSLPFIGAAGIRERLEAAPFIKSAEVRKFYPGELALSIVEREPFALWQKDGELFVVARDGTVIDRLRDASLAGLPLVVGEGANERAFAYAALLEAAGPLRGRIRAGTLVSGRRWNLKMENGLDVRLPEEGAPAAVARLARLDREAGLLGKDVLAIDLRMPDRVVVRLTEEAAAARQDSVKKKLQRGVKGVDT